MNMPTLLLGFSAWSLCVYINIGVSWSGTGRRG